MDGGCLGIHRVGTGASFVVRKCWFSPAIFLPPLLPILLEFPSSHPSKYKPKLSLLSFRDQQWPPGLPKDPSPPERKKPTSSATSERNSKRNQPHMRKFPNGLTLPPEPAAFQQSHLCKVFFSSTKISGSNIRNKTKQNKKTPDVRNIKPSSCTPKHLLDFEAILKIICFLARGNSHVVLCQLPWENRGHRAAKYRPKTVPTWSLPLSLFLSFPFSLSFLMFFLNYPRYVKYYKGEIIRILQWDLEISAWICLDLKPSGFLFFLFLHQEDPGDSWKFSFFFPQAGFFMLFLCKHPFSGFWKAVPLMPPAWTV